MKMGIWEKLYNTILERDCEKAKKLFNSLTLEDKESPYFLKYAQLLAQFCPEKNPKKNKVYYKGKTIKCPSCGSPLSGSEYNLYQLKKLKSGVDSVIFVCNYCGNKIAYSKTPFKTIFTNYSVGQEIQIGFKKYVLSGAVRYKGSYLEGNEKGRLKYIEWLAYDKNGEIYYISESRAIFNDEKYDELEISKKVDFPFVVKKISFDKIDTSDGEKPVEEYDEVKVVSVFGDVNKKYKIGERVKLWNFKKYALEEETDGEYVERNLYKNIFSKDYLDGYGDMTLDGGELAGYAYLVFMILILLLSFSVKCTLSWFVVVLLSFFIFTDRKISKGNILTALIIGSLISFSTCILPLVYTLIPGSSGGSYSSSSSYWGSSSYGGGK